MTLDLAEGEEEVGVGLDLVEGTEEGLEAGLEVGVDEEGGLGWAEVVDEVDLLAAKGFLVEGKGLGESTALLDEKMEWMFFLGGGSLLELMVRLRLKLEG